MQLCVCLSVLVCLSVYLSVCLHACVKIHVQRNCTCVHGDPYQSWSGAAPACDTKGGSELLKVCLLCSPAFVSPPTRFSPPPLLPQAPSPRSKLSLCCPALNPPPLPQPLQPCCDISSHPTPCPAPLLRRHLGGQKMSHSLPLEPVNVHRHSQPKRQITLHQMQLTKASEYPNRGWQVT